MMVPEEEDNTMFMFKLIGKILLLPVILVYGILKLLVKIGMELSSLVLGALMLVVFGCIIFSIIQHTWSSTLILVMIEAVLILITAGTGVIEEVISMAGEGLGKIMRA